MNPFMSVVSLLVFTFATLDCSVAQEMNCEHPETTVAMAGCEEKELAQAEAKMQRIYERVLAFFDTSSSKSADEKRSSVRVRNQLQESQAAWLKYRQTFCAAVEETYEGGTGASMAVPGCKRDLTEQRAKALQDWMGPDNSKGTRPSERPQH
jgi:uncharacterized protein YecT (DUF1311 family)